MRSLHVSATLCFVLSTSTFAFAETPEAAPPTLSATVPAPVTSAAVPTGSAPTAKASSAPAPAASAASEPAAPTSDVSSAPAANRVGRSSLARHDDSRGREASAEPEVPDGSSYRPPVVVAYEGGRVPKDSQLEQRPRAGLIATGIALTGSAYAAALTYAISTCGAQMECRHGSAWLYAPIIGPFVTATRAPTSGGMALAAFDGAVQSIGVALFAAGFLAPKTMVVTYRDTAIRLAPVSVGSSMGLGVMVQSL
jgi:hypothetical protein